MNNENMMSIERMMTYAIKGQFQAITHIDMINFVKHLLNENKTLTDWNEKSYKDGKKFAYENAIDKLSGAGLVTKEIQELLKELKKEVK